jgi:hypothetical protein
MFRLIAMAAAGALLAAATTAAATEPCKRSDMAGTWHLTGNEHIVWDDELAPGGPVLWSCLIRFDRRGRVREIRPGPGFGGCSEAIWWVELNPPLPVASVHARVWPNCAGTIRLDNALEGDFTLSQDKSVASGTGWTVDNDGYIHFTMGHLEQ